MWRHVREWPHEGADLIDHALASLTTGWSFSEEICVESVVNREVDDLITVIEIFREEVAPFLFKAARRMDMAQHLFAGMVVGQIPREFEESHMMAATGWSWQALQATPIDVVQKMALYLAVSDARNTQGSLDFTECEKEGPYDNR